MNRPDHEAKNLEIVTRYLSALGDGDLAGAFALLDPSVTFDELPNRVSPNGTHRDLASMEAGAERGKKLMASQRYDMKSATTEGDRVVVEVEWTGTLAVPLGALPAGHVMRAHSAMVIELRDGRIRKQRNYDCFEPW